jgi:hypothetical protein
LGAGVDVESEALSLTSGTFKVSLSSATAAGDEAAEAGDCSSDFTGFSWKRRRSFGASFSTTTLVRLLFLSARIEADGDRVVEADMVVDGVRGGGKGARRQ